jgi:hypothetical protein
MTGTLISLLGGPHLQAPVVVRWWFYYCQNEVRMHSLYM